MNIIFSLILSICGGCTDENIFYEALEEEMGNNVISNPTSNAKNNSTAKGSGTKAFPTAEGAGKFATGGRGGQVIHVTNLNDSGPGSLREALTQTFPRTIVFDVSGIIHLTSPIGILDNMGNFTLAGQTAPLGGIAIQGHQIGLSDNGNAIIRYIRIRGTKAQMPYGQVQALSIWRSSNVIVDHCSFSYASKSMVGMGNMDERDDLKTMQRCVIGESQTGVLMSAEYVTTGRINFTFYKNLIANNSHRTPNLQYNVDGEVINNVIYNWYNRLSNTVSNTRANFIGNYYKAGPITDQQLNAGNIIGNRRLNLVKTGDPTKVYLEGNYWYDYPSLTADNWLGWTHSDPWNNALADQSQKRIEHEQATKFNFAYPVLNISSAQDAYVDVMNDVGANKTLDENGNIVPFIDSVDMDLINDTNNRTYVNMSPDGYYEWFYPGEVADLGNTPSNTRPAGFDTDGDGMPNAWEIANGFDPNVADNNGDADGDGYTNLEEYLNEVDKE